MNGKGIMKEKREKRKRRRNLIESNNQKIAAETIRKKQGIK